MVTKSKCYLVVNHADGQSACVLCMQIQCARFVLLNWCFQLYRFCSDETSIYGYGHLRSELNIALGYHVCSKSQ